MDTDEHPLRALFDAVHSERHQSAAYDVGSAVQGAVNEKGGVRWRDGEVVQNIDGDAITVRFDDGVEETYRLPDDRSELRSVPQNIKDEDAMSADKTNTGHGEADSAGDDSQEYEPEFDSMLDRDDDGGGEAHWMEDPSDSVASAVPVDVRKAAGDLAPWFHLPQKDAAKKYALGITTWITIGMSALSEQLSQVRHVSHEVQETLQDTRA